MPGRDQLKRFNSDMLSVGDEVVKRAARGEKPITVPIPATVKDADDSEDFVLGMPEGVSDMNGGVAMSQAESTAVDAPDLIEDVSGLDAGDIDFSQFEDNADNNAAASDILGGMEGLEELDTGALEPLESEDAKAKDTVPAPEIQADDAAQSFDAAALPDEADAAAEDAADGEEAESNDAAIFDDAGEIKLNEEFPEGLDNVVPDVGAEEAGAKAMPQGDAPPPASDDFNVDDALAGIDFGDESAAGKDAAEDADVAAADAAMPDMDAAMPEMDAAESAEAAGESSGDFDIGDALKDFDFGDLEEPKAAEDAPVQDNVGGAAGTDGGIDAADVLSGLDFDGLEEPEAIANEQAAEAVPEAMPDIADATEAISEPSPVDGEESAAASTAAPNPLAALDFNMGDVPAASGIDIGDALSGLDLDELDGDGAGEKAGEGDELAVPIETFDAPEMEGVDFSADGGDTGFELDEDALHIPGFTDTDTAQDVHARPAQNSGDKDDEAEKNGLPPNTLTEKQYSKFKDNFAEYPLNVRQAFENMIVQNEFTDDAQFEVVAKILKKSSARHVASHLERMLDVSLPVPRDYERRTASEYAAYKSSFKYQLYNKIIPAALVCVAGVLLAVGLFMFVRKFIYKPIVANRLYKQGYALLEANEYPQSESKFVDATKYKMVKKWFYKYARAYRERKQYHRAEKMYGNILYCFNHDKQAGIEYAQMECYDLANYEKAEQVARREVLDYHINDPDGILLLGDVFLEWGTEKDASKFEEAKKQYALLVQLYGQTDLYLSRMMRYFIRTDNLREVLPLKEHFYANRKTHLGSEDWTELSGFMLDKLYGQLSPVDEELRIRIEDVMDMLRRAVRADPSNPVAMYNLSRYYVKRNNSENAKSALNQTLALFNSAQRRSSRDMYKELDSYRMLGEEYVKGREYIKAQEIYTDGITLFEKEKRNSGFEGDKNVGRLYADAGDIDYFIRGDMDGAFNEYTSAVETKCDTPSLRYRLGYIHYNRGELTDAINSFIKASEDNHDDAHLLLAMANTLSLRDDNYGAQSYYERLVSALDTMRAQKGILLPQVRSDQAEIVDLYLKASNNLGVTLGRLARRTGDSVMNANALVNLTTSMRAWDALTRNQTTMVRLPGSNLAEQNLQYMSRPVSDFEPAIYTEIPRILTGEAELHQ